jgi:hypothetical protein
MKITIKVKRGADLDAAMPGLLALWRAIKADTGSRVARPTLTLTDEPSPMYPDDSSCARRYLVDVERMRIVSRVHVSCGEWAGPHEKTQGATGLPKGLAIADCEWNDYYRSFSLRVQVAAGLMLPDRVVAVPALTGGAS